MAWSQRPFTRLDRSKIDRQAQALQLPVHDAAGVLPVPCSQASVIVIDIQAEVTEFSFQDLAVYGDVLLTIRMTGAQTVAWTGVDKWDGRAVPTLTADGEDHVLIWDAGGTVYGKQVGTDVGAPE